MRVLVAPLMRYSPPHLTHTPLLKVSQSLTCSCPTIAPKPKKIAQQITNDSTLPHHVSRPIAITKPTGRPIKPPISRPAIITSDMLSRPFFCIFFIHHQSQQSSTGWPVHQASLRRKKRWNSSSHHFRHLHCRLPYR